MKFRHKKRGTVYEIIETATMQIDNPEYDNETVVVYRDDHGRVWARLEEEFYDGRFEQLPEPAGSKNDQSVDLSVINKFVEMLDESLEGFSDEDGHLPISTWMVASDWKKLRAEIEKLKGK